MLHALSMTLAVFCYGELGIDNIIRLPHLPTPERAAFPFADTYHIGGAAANTAVWLAGWGVPVGLAGNAIGHDDHGRQLIDWLGRYPSLDRRSLEVRQEVATPFCRILVTPDGERSILVYGYPQTPKTELTVEMLDGARFLALDLYGGDERLAAVKVARAAGAQTVITDVAWPDHRALPLADIALVSAAYVREQFPGVDVIGHARQLQSINRGIVVLTDGARKVSVVDKEGALFHVQPPAVEAVDATGAGDAFRAGLIYGLLQGWPLPESVCFATAAGALKVMRVGGGSDVPAKEEVTRLAATLQSTSGYVES
jgi:sugar/nucleoside kinase (ribokinase family)